MPHSQIQNCENGHHPAPEEFQILKAAPDKEYAEILFLCVQLCRCRAAALQVIEYSKAWTKTTHGMDPSQLPTDDFLWKIVLDQQDVVVISNSDKDLGVQKQISEPFQTYVGVPLITSSGECLGVIMIFDEKEVSIDEDQRRGLRFLARQLLNLVAFRKQNNQYLRVQHKLEQKYNDLEKFASVVSHDLKSPLANIISLTELLKEENQDTFNDDTRQYLDFLLQASQSLRSYVDGLLIFYRSEHLLEKEEEDFELEAFFEKIVKLYSVNPDVEITYPTYGKLKKVNKAALTQIFMNLISNALKYNSKPNQKVDITFRPTDDYYIFEVKDNGNGIPAESYDRIFELFATLDQNDREGNPGSGIGLATVKKLLDHMDGHIEIESEPEKGSNFIVKIKRSY